MNETVLVSGRDVVYRHLAGEAPALVLVHGAGSNHAAFDELTVQLGGQEMIIPSLPGRCGSEGEPLRTAGEMGAWLGKLLRTIGLRRVVVAGHSLGGAAAIEYALAAQGHGAPELLGLVLISTGARLRVHPELLAAARDAAEWNLPCALPAEAWERDPEPELVRHVESNRARTPARVTVVDWEAADAFDRMRDLGSIRVPTMVIAGSEDRLTPERYARYLAEHIPGAHLELLYGAGHMCVAERPAEVARRLRDFVAAVRSR